MRSLKLMREANRHRDAGYGLLLLVTSVEHSYWERKVADAHFVDRDTSAILALLNVWQDLVRCVFHSSSIELGFRVFRPGTAGFPEPYLDDADGWAERIQGSRCVYVSAQSGLEFLVDAMRHDFCRGVLVFETDDPVPICLFPSVVVRVPGVDAEGVIPSLQEIVHCLLERFEVGNHFILIEVVSFQHKLDLAAVAVGEFADVRMLGQHVPVLDFE